MKNRKRLINLFLGCVLFLPTVLYSQNTTFKFDFTGEKKGEYIQVSTHTVYGRNSTYGYDLNTVQKEGKPFFFSLDVPEGNYKVKVVLGNDLTETCTTVKSESRRLMLENIKTEKGEYASYYFIVNIRNYRINENDTVKIKPGEVGKLIWDDKLTLEFNGVHPSVAQIEVEKADHLPTIFLAGNSTVVDQSNEPWCGWGQMFTRFLKPDIAVANYAESGLSATSFIHSGRIRKLLTQMKKGDYLFIEFGHNDQKEKGEGKGPYTSYKTNLKQLVNHAREKGGIPVLITPMHRRRFDENGKIVNTHGDYPDAVRQLAAEENVILIDLTEMSQVLYEAWGVDDSKKAFVHYPAGTFPNQEKALADDTHFNSYGGYEIARCIVKGIVDNNIDLKSYILDEFLHFDPACPDNMTTFNLPPTPFASLIKPDGD